MCVHGFLNGWCASPTTDPTDREERIIDDAWEPGESFSDTMRRCYPEDLSTCAPEAWFYDDPTIAEVAPDTMIRPLFRH